MLIVYVDETILIGNDEDGLTTPKKRLARVSNRGSGYFIKCFPWVGFIRSKRKEFFVNERKY